MSEKPEPEDTWTIEDAKAMYHILRWGQNYFDIDDSGCVIVRPIPEKPTSIRMKTLIADARRRKLEFPLLIRFQDIVRHRVESLNKAFQQAIREYGYKGRYRGVFPIKVNQLREVVEEILDAGAPYDFGLEVGSKSELHAGLALQTNADALIVCNGYKDRHFIRMALLGTKLGKEVILIVEKLEELSHIIKLSKEMKAKPLIGIRSRLLCKGSGKWAESGGENAKFGLSTTELLVAAKWLKKAKMESCFNLLHFHIGSQVPDISTITRAAQEATRLYAQIYRMGFQIEQIDVGGGLGVDYDGSRTDFESSTNYTLQEYANDVVYHISEICNLEKVPHPNLISESGRAIVAHHSVLVVEVFGAIQKITPHARTKFGKREHRLVKEMLEIRSKLSRLNKLEALHDAMENKNGAHHMFTLGMLSLEDKAKIESLYWEIGAEIVKAFQGKDLVPEEIQALKDSLCDQYLCNFSVFQSLLDHWALNQLFPIMPLDRLNQRPDREAVLVDITCDSDGQINKFIDFEDVRDTLPLHSLERDKRNRQKPYYLGIFLTGAYQDIMGDLHNLFGRVNEVHVFLDPEEPDGYYVEEIIEGSNVSESLSNVQYDEKDLKRKMKAQIDKAIKKDRLKSSEAMDMLAEYEKGLKDYTYLSLG